MGSGRRAEGSGILRGTEGRGLTQTVTDAHSLAKHSQGSAANGEQPTSEAERGQGALKS